jgi:hypothetical protein
MPTYFNYSYANSIFPLDDGRLIVTGRLNYAWPPFLGMGARSMACLKNDGSLDTTFTAASGGPFITPWRNRFYTGPYARRHFADGAIDYSFNLGASANNYVMSVYPYSYHVYEDGSVLLSGAHTLYDADTVAHDVNVVRMDSTGNFDPSFAPRTINYNGNYSYMGLTKAISGDRFILSGTIFAYEGVPTGRIVRIHANGELDTTFMTTANWGYGYDCLEQPDGKLLVVGAFTFDGDPDTLNVVRLMPDGSLDPTYNNTLSMTRGGPAYEYPFVTGITAFVDSTYILSGYFVSVGGYSRGGIVVVDRHGQVVPDGIADPGCGSRLLDQIQVGGIVRVVPARDGSYYAHGGFFGYADEGSSDSTQRVVIRLKVAPEPEAPAPTYGDEPVIHPNPAHGQFTLTGLPEGESRIEIYAMTGQLVMSAVAHDRYYTVQVPVLAAGMYSVIVRGAGRQWMLRQVLE